MAIADRPAPGTLILLRHGESTWNLENLFTGWTDVPLSERGVKEAVEAGTLMKKAGLRPVFRERHVVPPGEQVLEVPRALPVPEQHEHASLSA